MNIKCLTCIGLFSLFFICCETDQRNMAIPKTQAYFDNTINELEKYKVKHGSYPDNNLGLKILLQEKDINTENRTVRDAWGNPFGYKIPGAHNPQSYDLWSYGADNLPGGEGENADITNW